MGGRRCYRDLPWMMDCLVSRDREVEIDLESGGTTSEEDRTNSLVSTNGQTTQLLNRAWNGPFDGLVSSSKFCEGADDNVGLLIDKNSEAEESLLQMVFADKKHVEEKRKKKNSKKPPRPPRPPSCSSLDAADQRLMREIAELALRKRARIERIKALKKMRAAKASSWSSSLFAMVITVLFCLVIIFQGICSGNNGRSFLRGSPEPAVAGSEDFISLQFYKNFSAHRESEEPGYGSNSLADGQVSGLGLRKK